MHKVSFRATALSSTETFAPLGKIINPLIGIDVKLPDTCKQCGSEVAIIGPAPVPHRASLHCQECRQFRGWVSNEAFRFVAKIVEQFGKPAEPILIHRGKSEPEDGGAR
jgi:hypothetical protein